MSRTETLAEKRRKTIIILSGIIVLLLAVVALLASYVYVANDTLKRVKEIMPKEVSELIDENILLNMGENTNG